MPAGVPLEPDKGTSILPGEYAVMLTLFKSILYPPTIVVAVIDSHTGGEPTRRSLSVGPDLGSAPS